MDMFSQSIFYTEKVRKLKKEDDKRENIRYYEENLWNVYTPILFK